MFICNGKKFFESVFGLVSTPFIPGNARVRPPYVNIDLTRASRGFITAWMDIFFAWAKISRTLLFSVLANANFVANPLTTLFKNRVA